MNTILKYKEVKINNIARMVAISIEPEQERLTGKLGNSKFIWEYKKFFYPTVQTIISTANADKAGVYGRLYILERLRMDNIVIDGIIQSKRNVEFMHLEERCGVYCNVFSNSYVRGKIDGVKYSWNSKVFNNAVTMNDYGIAVEKFKPDRIIDRIQKAGFSTVEEAVRAVRSGNYVAKTSSTENLFTTTNNNISNDDPFSNNNISNTNTNNAPPLPTSTTTSIPISTNTTTNSLDEILISLSETIKMPIAEIKQRLGLLQNDDRFVYLTSCDQDICLKAYANKVTWTVANDKTIWQWNSNQKINELDKTIASLIRSRDFNTPNDLWEYVLSCTDDNNYNKYKKFYQRLWELDLEYRVIEELKFSDSAVSTFVDNVYQCVIENDNDAEAYSYYVELCNLANIDIKVLPIKFNTKSNAPVNESNVFVDIDNTETLIRFYQDFRNGMRFSEDIIEFLYSDIAPNYHFGLKLDKHNPEFDFETFFGLANADTWRADWKETPSCKLYKDHFTFVNEEGFSEYLCNYTPTSKCPYDVESVLKLFVGLDTAITNSKMFSFSINNRAFYSLLDLIKYYFEISKGEYTFLDDKLIITQYP